MTYRILGWSGWCFVLVIVVCGGWAVPVQAGTITLSDDTFNPTDWSTTRIVDTIVMADFADDKVEFKCCDGATFKVTDLEVTWQGKINSFSFRFPDAAMCDTSIKGMTTKLLCKKEIENGIFIEAEADATYVSAIWTGAEDKSIQANPVPEPGTWLLFSTGLVGILGYGWRPGKKVAYAGIVKLILAG